MKTVTKPVGTRDEHCLGNIQFPVFESIDEASDKYGQEIVLALLNKSISSELERVARDNLKKEGSTEDSVQKLVDEYQPGVRATKPSLKNFTKLAGEFAAAANFDALSKAYDLHNEEGVEAAFNYLKELKDQGKLVTQKTKAAK
jgi:hypothetical protein